MRALTEEKAVIRAAGLRAKHFLLSYLHDDMLGMTETNFSCRGNGRGEQSSGSNRHEHTKKVSQPCFFFVRVEEWYAQRHGEDLSAKEIQLKMKKVELGAAIMRLPIRTISPELLLHHFWSCCAGDKRIRAVIWRRSDAMWHSRRKRCCFSARGKKQSLRDFQIYLMTPKYRGVLLQRLKQIEICFHRETSVWPSREMWGWKSEENSEMIPLKWSVHQSGPAGRITDFLGRDKKQKAWTVKLSFRPDCPLCTCCFLHSLWKAETFFLLFQMFPVFLLDSSLMNWRRWTRLTEEERPTAAAITAFSSPCLCLRTSGRNNPRSVTPRRTIRGHKMTTRGPWLIPPFIGLLCFPTLPFTGTNLSRLNTRLKHLDYRKVQCIRHTFSTLPNQKKKGTMENEEKVFQLLNE